MNDDRVYRVRPIFHHLNNVMKTNKTLGGSVSADEIMVLYNGRRGDKQYIRGKPASFGFKLWGA